MANPITLLLKPRGEDQVFDDLAAKLESYLDANGQPLWSITDYESGGVAYTLLKVEAATLADVYALVPVIAGSGFLTYAEGPWLDELAGSGYALERKRSAWAEHAVVLTAEPGFGPYTLQPADIWATTGSGLRFNSFTAGTLADGGTLTLSVIAEFAGSAYNVPAGAIDTLLTPLPGVTITNPTGSLTKAGVDTETDDSLRQRCRLRWATLGGGATRAAYEFWALTARAEVTQVRVRDDLPRGEGTVDVIVWGPGGLGLAVLADVNAYIQQRRPITADVRVYAATEVNIPVTATITVRANRRAFAEARAIANITALQRALEIGGLVTDDAIITALRGSATDGAVLDVDLSAPVGDQQLAFNEVAAFTLNLTWLEV